MSMSGKMSVGIRRIVATPRMTMSIDITTKVYGRRSARRTIHMGARNADHGHPTRPMECSATIPVVNPDRVFDPETGSDHLPQILELVVLEILRGEAPAVVAGDEVHHVR